MVSNDPRYAFTIEGGPTTVAAKCKALAHAGPLVIAKDHVLAVWLPEAFDEKSGHPDKRTTSCATSWGWSSAVWVSHG